MVQYVLLCLTSSHQVSFWRGESTTTPRSEGESRSTQKEEGRKQHHTNGGRNAPYPSTHFLHSADTLKTMAGCLSCTFPSIRTKPAHTSWTPWSALQKKKAVGTSTRADACAFTSALQLSSYRRRFQTGENREKLAHMCTMTE